MFYINLFSNMLDSLKYEQNECGLVCILEDKINIRYNSRHLYLVWIDQSSYTKYGQFEVYFSISNFLLIIE